MRFSQPFRPSLRTLVVLLALFGVPIWGIAAQEPAKTDSPCDSRYEKIAKAYRSLPIKYRGMKSSDAKKLGDKVQTALKDCRDYLGACRSKDAVKTAQVEFYFAKNLYLLSAQFRAGVIEGIRKENPGSPFPSDQLDAQMKAYYSTMARSTGAAFNGLPKDSKLKPLALKLLGQSHSGAKTYADARDAYKQFRELYPNHDDVASVTTALARAYLRLEEFDEGIALVRQAQKNRRIYNSSSYPYLGEALWKLQEAKGDFDGMLSAARGTLRIGELRIADPKISSFEKEDYKRYRVFNGFRVAYVLFALGRFDEASDGFREYIQRMESRGKDVRSKGGELPPYARIYQKRASDCLDFLESFVGQSPPTDFDLGNLWVTDSQVTFKKNLGQVIAVVFRGVEDGRSAPFLENFDDFCEGQKDVRLLTISFLRGKDNPQEQIDKLAFELDNLDYTGAAGFDPDATRKSLFRSFNANVGSATFIVFGKNGTPIWFQQDPRSVDVNLAISIVKRAIKD